MIEQNINSPLTSSAGRLFDAVAAALSLAPERCSYEAQAAMQLEAVAKPELIAELSPYPFTFIEDNGLLEIDPAPMWTALLDDLQQEADVATMATRFHLGLADAFVKSTVILARKYHVKKIALSGGVFQNRLLFENVQSNLQANGFDVLTHRQLPANDGGLSVGQAAVAAAQLLHNR
jgi:hydrogenase maturation protein HypF